MPANRKCSPLALVLLAGLAACAPEGSGGPAGEQAAGEGRGLEILPYEDPTIGPVAEKDPRLYYHDFGNVPMGELVSRVFQLRNTDPRPVSIKRLVPSCGCTLPTVSYVRDDGEVVVGNVKPVAGESVITIPPGVVADLTLEIDTRLIKNANVDKLLTATITTDSPNGFYLNLEAHIFVERPFTVVPETLNFGRIPVNGGGEKSVQVVQSPGFHRRVTEVVEQPEGVTAELSLDDSLDRSLWTLTVRVEPPLERGRLNGQIVLATQDELGEPSETIAVPLVADGVPDIQAEPARIVFSAERASSSAGSCVVRSLLQGHVFGIEEARVDVEHEARLEIAYEPVAPDPEGRSGAWKLTLKTVPPLEAGDGLLAGDVVLTLDDPQHPDLRVPFVLHLR